MRNPSELKKEEAQKAAKEAIILARGINAARAARSDRRYRKALLNGKSEARKKMQYFLANNVLDNQEIHDIIKNAHSMSAGEFKELCTKLANEQPTPAFPKTAIYNEINGLKAEAKDDARKVAFINFLEILTGEFTMAFRHITLFREPLKALEQQLKHTDGDKYDAFFKKAYECITCLDELAILKQQRIALLVNGKVSTINLQNYISGEEYNTIRDIRNASAEVPPFNELMIKVIGEKRFGEIDADHKRFFSDLIKDPNANILPDYTQLKLHPLMSTEDYNASFTNAILTACKLGINWKTYINTNSDKDEVDGVTNAFCFNQSKEFRAGDNLVFVVSKDGSICTLVILREFAPGIHSLALAGGMFDPSKCKPDELETPLQCSRRELYEETNIVVDALKFEALTIILQGIIPLEYRKCWDFRMRAMEAFISAVYNVIIPRGTIFYVPPK